MDEKTLASIFKVLGDENRIKIVDLLWDGEISARRLLNALSIRQSTLSHHMKPVLWRGAKKEAGPAIKSLQMA